jgi:hypothetical protein
MTENSKPLVVLLTPSEVLAITIVLSRFLQGRSPKTVPEGIRVDLESGLRKLDLKLGTIEPDQEV